MAFCLGILLGLKIWKGKEKFVGKRRGEFYGVLRV
jgi:hypothetical protein